eukprot:874536_1
MCDSCNKLQWCMDRHTENIRQNNNIPSKHANPRNLPNDQQYYVFDKQRQATRRLKKLCRKLKRKIDRYDTIHIRHKNTNEELYALHQYLDSNFDKLDAALQNKPLLIAFLKDQLKSALQDNKPSKYSSRGMRWSQATYQIAIHLACSSNSKCCERLNGLNIIKLPGDKMIKLKRYNFQNGQGVNDQLLRNIESSLTAHRKKCNVPLDKPFLCLKFDEIYIKNGIVYHPNLNKIIGITMELESGEFLNPLYELADAMMEDKNIDKDTLSKYSAKIVVQTILNDLGSSWKYVGPYWMFKKNAVAPKLYVCFIDKLLYPLHLMNMNIHVMMSDMSSTNLSFVKLLTNKRSNELMGGPILVNLPFYPHPFVYMFDPHHSLKNLRNALDKSIHKNMNILTNTYPLQTNGDIISWEHIEMLYNEDLDVDWVRHRTLSKDAVYLNPWTKQRVNLALDIFSDNVVSGLEYYKREGHDVDGTLQYIKAVRELLVGTFIDSTQANGDYDEIKKMDNPILTRIRSAWDWFARFQMDNEDSNLSTKTYLAISSIRFGFERIVSDFVEFYRNIETERRQRSGYITTKTTEPT